MDQRRIYCLVPIELAGRLHDTLRRHFGEDPEVEVVIERRHRERRSDAERRVAVADAAAAGLPEERRRIRSATGRRVADRRAATVTLSAETAPELPRRVRRHAGEIVFVERLEPSTDAAEDADSARLVTRIQAGDLELFSELYLRYFDRVYGYLKVLVKNSHEAEDLAQQAFTQAFEALPRYERRKQPFRGWLFTIVRNVAVSSLRGERELALESEEMDRKLDGSVIRAAEPDMSVLRWMSDQDFAILIERLPPVSRQVLALRFLVDMTATEIAEILGRSPNGVRQIQHRALRSLEARLRPRMRDRELKPERRAQMRRWPKRAAVIRARRFSLM
jgi:RNA polymerase sigma-70 factor (ECF subfamily)